MATPGMAANAGEEEELRNIGAQGDPEKLHPRRRRRSSDTPNGHPMRRRAWLGKLWNHRKGNIGNWASCRDTQRFHRHLLMLLLLQQQNASTQRGPGPGGFGPRAQTSVWKHFTAEAAEAAKTQANAYEISESLRPELFI